MSIKPLVPLDGNISGGNSAGLDTPAGLQESCPDILKPQPEGLDPSSIPSPLALEEATAFLLKPRGTGADLSEAAATHTLVRGAELLLQGLTAGELAFRWLSVNELGSPALTEALDNAYPSGIERRIGLIHDVDDPQKVWGYVGPHGVPALSGAQASNLSTLRKKVQNAETTDATVVALLDRLRAPLQSENRWRADGDLPWMVLVDRVCAKLGDTPDEEVDFVEDVRSFGPFALQVSDPDDEGGLTREDFYLLGHAPGFTRRLARAMTADWVDPNREAGSGKAGRLQLTDRGEELAYFWDTTDTSVTDPDLGQGCVAGLAESIPSGLPPVADIPEHGAYEHFDRNHIPGMKRNLGELTEAIHQRPNRVSDVARVVAQYVPEAIGESEPVALSPSFESYLDGSEGQIRPSSAIIERLAEKGHAFILKPKVDGHEAVAFIEHGTENPQQEHFAVGDLSGLGAALWQAFTGASYDASIGFYDSDGRPLLVTSYDDFPVAPGESAGEWWKRTGGDEARERLATLQRFLGAYRTDEEAKPTDALLEAAARSFVDRLSLEASDLLYPVKEGAFSGAASHEINLEGYGALDVRIDPFL